MSDYLDPSEWLHLAQQLDRGRKAMHPHICGEGNKLLVEHAENGFKAWCYRCSMPGFVPHPKPSLGERIAALREQRVADAAVEADPRPPMPANFNPSTWPASARVWLYKCGLSNVIIKEHGIYWCDRIKRVVLPVLDGPRLVYWQARGFDPERPKYLNPQIDKPIYKSGPYSLPGPLVLTEDILSAIKVGQVATAWSLLGTAMPDAVAAEIANLGVSVAVWLDPDAAGRKGRLRVTQQLRALGVDARIIRAEQDPKYYSVDQIREFILEP
jgi:DNA primase